MRSFRARRAMSPASHLLAVLLLATALAPGADALVAALPEPGEALPPHIQCHIMIFGICLPNPPYLPLVCDLTYLC